MPRRRQGVQIRRAGSATGRNGKKASVERAQWEMGSVVGGEVRGVTRGQITSPGVR